MAPPSTKPSVPSFFAGLSPDEAAAADKDHLYFLEHLRPDGISDTLVIPSKDDVSPPETIRSKQPLPGHSAGAPAAECRGKGAPPPAEENSRTKRKAPRGVERRSPRGVKCKAPDASPGGEVRGAAAPMEEGTPTQGLEPAWDDAPDIDADYRFLLQHSSLENGKLVFRTAEDKVTIGDDSDPEEEDDTEKVEKKVEEEENDEQEGNPASTNVDTEKEEGPDSALANVSELERVNYEEVSEEEEEEAVGNNVVKGEEASEEDEVEMEANGKNVGTASDLQIVNYVMYEPEKEVEEGEKLSKSPVRGTTDLDPLDKKEAGSSKRHPAMPLNASESQGVVWPQHISERPYSVFKEKLIECLLKPFKQEEYDRYFAMATKRTPMIKERRTRNSVMYYPWKHEIGKSYFDMYPDLAEQFRLQCNNYSNGLALLRGLFFWLESVGEAESVTLWDPASLNVGLEDQFRPWSNEFKRYRVVPY